MSSVLLKAAIILSYHRYIHSVIHYTQVIATWDIYWVVYRWSETVRRVVVVAVVGVMVVGVEVFSDVLQYTSLSYLSLH